MKFLKCEGYIFPIARLISIYINSENITITFRNDENRDEEIDYHNIENRLGKHIEQFLCNEEKLFDVDKASSYLNY